MPAGITYIAGDLTNVQKDLPKTIHSSMAVVMLSLETVNISYYILLPWRDIGSNNAVAVVAILTNFGFIFATLTALLVSISCVGAINGQMFAGGRLIASSAGRGYLPSVFGRPSSPFFFTQDFRARREPTQPATSENTTGGGGSQGGVLSTESLLGAPREPKSSPDSIPALAFLLNAILAGIYVIAGEFSFLLTLSGMAVWSFLFLTVLGVILLRGCEPNLDRPYQVALFIPSIFCCVAGTMVLSSAVFAPIPALVLLTVCTMCILVHFIKR